MQERNEALPGLLYEAELPAPQSASASSKIPSNNNNNRSPAISERVAEATARAVGTVKVPAPGALTVGLASLVGLMTEEERKKEKQHAGGAAAGAGVQAKDERTTRDTHGGVANEAVEEEEIQGSKCNVDQCCYYSNYSYSYYFITICLMLFFFL